jgi:hypothetical protein
VRSVVKIFLYKDYAVNRDSLIAMASWLQGE